MRAYEFINEDLIINGYEFPLPKRLHVQVKELRIKNYKFKLPKQLLKNIKPEQLRK